MVVDMALQEGNLVQIKYWRANFFNIKVFGANKVLMKDAGDMGDPLPQPFNVYLVDWYTSFMNICIMKGVHTSVPPRQLFVGLN